MNAAIVTGPTGVIGANLVRELVAHGVAVTAVIRPDSARSGNLPRHPLVTVVPCPIEQLETLPQRLGGQPFDVLYHFAWDGTYGASRTDEARQLANVAYTLSAVRAARALSCHAFVGSGSQAEYGRVDGVLTPDTPCRPLSAYGIAKLAAGRQSRVLCDKLGLRHNWCRILSVYGPFDGAHTMVMQAVSTMLAGRVLPCTKGDQIWDYLYAADAARAFRMVGERGRDGAVYCLGSGQTRTLSAFITAIRDAIDPTLPIGFGELPYYPDQVMRMQADITSLTADTGFTPLHTFEQGIEKTAAWVRAQQACVENETN